MYAHSNITLQLTYIMLSIFSNYFLNGYQITDMIMENFCEFTVLGMFEMGTDQIYLYQVFLLYVSLHYLN